MEKILNQILGKINDLDYKIDTLDNKVSVLDDKVSVLDDRVNLLDITVNGIKDEHGRMLRAIIEGKEVQRGEIDTLVHRTSGIERTIKGAAKQILDNLKGTSTRGGY